nr:hypothetical protein [Ningiella ruwaisensis]
MNEPQKTSAEVIDIVVDLASKASKIGIVCFVLSILILMGY